MHEHERIIREMENNANQNGKSILIIFNVIGFLFALAGLIYKVSMAARYFDGIREWWNDEMILLYFMFYMTSIAAMASSFFKGIAGIAFSAVIMIVSCFLLFVDGCMFLGFAASLNTGSMIEKGIAPLVNVLNLIAGVFNLIGSLRFKNRA